MGYPYSWHARSNAGISGPTPQSFDYKNHKRDFDLYGHSDQERFYAGFTSLDYKSLIRASIQRILMTNPGERLMLPDFGCDLRKFVFEQGDSILGTRIIQEICRALNKWEPRITVGNVDIQMMEDNRILVIVPYVINGTDIEDTINYVITSHKKSQA